MEQFNDSCHKSTKPKFYPIIKVKIYMLDLQFLIPIVLSCTAYGAHASLRSNMIDYIPDPRGTKTPVQQRNSLDYVWPIYQNQRSFCWYAWQAQLELDIDLLLIANQFPS